MTARDVWVADSETDPFDGVTFVSPFLWGCYNGSEYHQFATTDAFLEFITASPPKICYAHNGGRFDWFFILHALEGWQPITVINGRLAKFEIGECEFRDSYNILPSPLSAYKKDDIDYKIFTKSEREKKANRLKIEDYLRNDCIYLHQYITQFIGDYGLHLTFATAALKTWSRMSKIDIPNTGRAFFDALSIYYYGGRVECKSIGVIKRPLKVIDINSAYPEAMTHKHPWGDQYTESKILPTDPDQLNRAFITLSAPSKGALPLREKTGLSFPDDGETRTFNITGWEFCAAHDTGALPWYTVTSVVSFTFTIEFNDYVQHFSALKIKSKEQGDRARYEFAKFFLNGLSGKFGANPEHYEEFTVVPPDMIDAAKEVDGYGFCAEIGPWALVSRPLPESKHHYYNVAVIASITGFVRAKLWRAAARCTGVHYMDTDCLHCEDTGDLPLHPTLLGAWDVEAECVLAAYAGKKLYALKKTNGAWKTASKGVRLEAHEIVEIAKGAEVEYKSQAPSFSLKTGTKFIKRKIKRKEVDKAPRARKIRTGR